MRCALYILNVRSGRQASPVASLEARGVVASAGSACHAGETSLSPVLLAMGLDAADGGAIVRFSFGRATTEGDVDAALEALASERVSGR